MPRRHGLEQHAWLKHYQADDANFGPPIADLLQPANLVDDQSHVVAPVVVPTSACRALEIAYAGLFTVVCVIAGVKGCLLSIVKSGGVYNFGLLTADPITANRTVVVPSWLEGQMESSVQTGTSGAAASLGGAAPWTAANDFWYDLYVPPDHVAVWESQAVNGAVNIFQLFLQEPLTKAAWR